MSTHNILFLILKKKITLNLQPGDFFQGTPERVQTAVVNMSSVFEPMKFYCIRIAENCSVGKKARSSSLLYRHWEILYETSAPLKGTANHLHLSAPGLNPPSRVCSLSSLAMTELLGVSIHFKPRLFNIPFCNALFPLQYYCIHVHCS